jgi:hypothetical protein
MAVERQWLVCPISLLQVLNQTHNWSFSLCDYVRVLDIFSSLLFSASIALLGMNDAQVQGI